MDVVPGGKQDPGAEALLAQRRTTSRAGSRSSKLPTPPRRVRQGSLMAVSCDLPNRSRGRLLMREVFRGNYSWYALILFVISTRSTCSYL